MTHEEKINYMNIASRLVGFGFKPQDLDYLVSLYDGVMKKKGEFSLKDVAKIKVEVDGRERVRNVSDSLDKVSEQVKP